MPQTRRPGRDDEGLPFLSCPVPSLSQTGWMSFSFLLCLVFHLEPPLTFISFHFALHIPHAVISLLVMCRSFGDDRLHSLFLSIFVVWDAVLNATSLNLSGNLVREVPSAPFYR